MNLVLSLLVIGASSLSIWGGITNPEGGVFAGIARGLRGEDQVKGSGSAAAFVASVAAFTGSGAGASTSTAPASKPKGSGKTGGYKTDGKTTVPLDGTTGTRRAVLTEARSFLGHPYAWGGNGPYSFDCSGLTKWVYSHAAGITLPRVSAAQALKGRAVKTAQAGDLVFWGIPAHHVGIALGDGTMIHAPHPGAVVRIEKITASIATGPITIRDVLSGKTPKATSSTGSAT